MPIPLGFVDNFWRTLSVPWPVVRNTQERDEPEYPEEPQGPEEPEYFSCQDDVQKFQSVFTKASSFVKKNMLNRLRGIYAPESVSTQQPAVKDDNRGRPSAKDNKSKAKKNIPDLNEEPPTGHRRSYTKPKKIPYLNEEAARHSSYVGEPSNVPDLNVPDVNSEGDLRHHLYVPDVNSEDFMAQIPPLFRRWILGIFNVAGDGNCGYRALAVGLGHQEQMWPMIRAIAREEIDTHEEVYRQMWDDNFTNIRNSMNWFEGPAPQRYWMTMPETGVAIATALNRPIVCIANRQSIMCLPLRDGPNTAQILSPVVILRVGEDQAAHFVLAFLDENSPLPYNHPQWRWFRNDVAGIWAHMFTQRQSMFRQT